VIRRFGVCSAMTPPGRTTDGPQPGNHLAGEDKIDLPVDDTKVA